MDETDRVNATQKSIEGIEDTGCRIGKRNLNCKDFETKKWRNLIIKVINKL